MLQSNKETVDTIVRYRINKYRYTDSIQFILASHQVIIQYSTPTIELAREEASLLHSEISNTYSNCKIEYGKNFTIRLKW